MFYRPTILTLTLLATCGTSVFAYTPDHPEVQAMIARGVKYLQAPNPKDTPHHQFGSEMLYAYAIHKVNHDPSDAAVKLGISKALSFINEQTTKPNPDHYISYAGALAMLLLLDVDAEGYRAQITAMANRYLSLQKSHGSFSYPSEDRGDNSQNQYAVLAMWSLKKKKFNVNPQQMERVAMYIASTQDPSGMWGYRGILGNPNKLVPQEKKRMSLTSAAGGSLIIAGDFFGFYKNRRKRGENSDNGLPTAVRLYDPEEAAVRARTTRFNTGLIDAAVGRAMNYYDKNTFRFSNFPKNLGFYFYAMYAHERFMSFYEVSQGVFEDEPAWYNQGVNDLKKLQGPEGDWGGKATTAAGMHPHLGVKENTAFAVLFLIRSTKKAIDQAQEGTAKGGYGLPTDTTNMKVQGTNFVDVASDGVDKLLDLLDQGEENQIDHEKIAASMRLSSDPAKRADEIKRLKRMVKGGPWQARRAAARLLGQSSDLDIVPTLIYALSDPDSVVKREARNGLRFVSRKFEGFGMPDKPNDKQVRDAIRNWKGWYLEANPSYVFVDP